MEDISQLQKEWLVVNGSREALSLVKKKNVSYKDSITFAKEIVPELLSNTVIGEKRKNSIEKLYEKYEQEAIANSRRLNKQVTAAKLINARISKLERDLEFYDFKEDEPDGLKKELSELKAALKLSPDSILNLERIFEGQAISSDSARDRANSLFVKNHSGKFKYNEYRNKDNGSIFRVQVLHPNPTEAILGADLIYEQYSVSSELVRIAAIQYKLWEDDVLYFSEAPSLEAQVKKMESFFCSGNYCSDEKGERCSFDHFRLPYCSAFLRPTDKLQNTNKLVTSGCHLPICQINRLKESTNRSYKLTRNGIKNASVNTVSFEKLFNDEMIGSRWLGIEELEKLYRKGKIIEPQQKIIIHVQNAIDQSLEPQDADFPF